MAWDSTRKVPWKRLTREWLLYVGLATVAYVIYYKMIQHKSIQVGLFAGLLSSGPMYLLFGAVLCKFGYQRKTMKDLRTEREARPATATARSGPGGAAGVRNRPAPTKRTSTGPSQYHKSKPKRR
ncbi:MAG: hypothetical protein JWL72_3451 [Ilumatobacteraceae bacterium]|nr:hypothetical protein [Ilumatobacteraceae bacterium]MCU1390113.1 hypothetical protein [Ilumatobacteraceae bacterium]